MIGCIICGIIGAIIGAVFGFGLCALLVSGDDERSDR